VTAVAVEIRTLQLSDLGAIEEIEQRAYPTPWSRSMFASELAKPTSICLGAFEGLDLVGYVINSRYASPTRVRSASTSSSASRRAASAAVITRTTGKTR